MAFNILHLGIVEEQFYLWGEKSPNSGSETLWKQRRTVPARLVVLNFSKPSTQNGYIILEKDNPSGLLEHDDQIRVPVTF